ncbi:MAG: hypothetical protein K6D96_03220 [Acetatifactor sp.]|nr:hypothetical protein [Acetatifactor sp.]
MFEKIKKITKIIVLFMIFMCILGLALIRLNSVMSVKAAEAVQKRFSEFERDSCDVVFVGNSHQFCSIDPMLLKDEFGIESFMLATSAQTVPMSYYAVMEAVEMQHPDRIVFEVSYCANDFRTVSNEMSHYFFDGMPVGHIKKAAIEDLIEDEPFWFYVPFGLYHTRWKELSETDFSDYEVNERGGVFFTETVPNSSIHVIDEGDMENMPEEMEKYMDKMVDYCRENGVELILYTAPFNTLYDGDETQLEDLERRERIFNYVGKYAGEKGIEYHNLFYEIDKLGIDDQTDWMDRQHLNANGQRKFTEYMANKGYIR